MSSIIMMNTMDVNPTHMFSGVIRHCMCNCYQLTALFNITNKFKKIHSVSFHTINQLELLLGEFYLNFELYQD